MTEGFRRQTAHKISISEIVEGVYRKDTESEPNHIVTMAGVIVSRVNILAAVVSKLTEDSNDVLMLDDGTGKLMARSFEKDLFKDVYVGDFVLIIGKPREYGNEKYILVEIIRKLPDSKWLEVRKKELSTPVLQDGHQNKNVLRNKINPERTDNEGVIEAIRKLDSGDGAEVNELLKSGFDEKSILYLIQRGDVYEIRPGKLKILE